MFQSPHRLAWTCYLLLKVRKLTTSSTSISCEVYTSHYVTMTLHTTITLKIRKYGSGRVQPLSRSIAVASQKSEREIGKASGKFTGKLREEKGES